MYSIFPPVAKDELKTPQHTAPTPLIWLFQRLFSLVVPQPFNVDDHLEIICKLRPNPLCRLNAFRAITWPNPASHKVQVQIDRSNPFRGGIGKP